MLSKLIVPKLREMAKANQIRGYSRMRKADLIQRLSEVPIAVQETPVEQPKQQPKQQTKQPAPRQQHGFKYEQILSERFPTWKRQGYTAAYDFFTDSKKPVSVKTVKLGADSVSVRISGIRRRQRISYFAFEFTEITLIISSLNVSITLIIRSGTASLSLNMIRQC